MARDEKIQMRKQVGIQAQWRLEQVSNCGISSYGKRENKNWKSMWRL